MIARVIPCLAVLLLLMSPPSRLAAAPPIQIGLERERAGSVQPLEALTVVGARAGTVRVLDATGREYARKTAAPRVRFEVGGSLGTHAVELLDEQGKQVDRVTFEVDAETRIEDDSGRFTKLFDMAAATATVRTPGRDSGPPGGHGIARWRGRDYRLFVTWVLDQTETSKGMAFFSPFMRDGVSLFRDSQRADGMIWSFILPDSGIKGHWDTAYGPLGYVFHDGGALFVRQPVENHVEYEFVNMLYQAWKASGDDDFMRASLDAAVRALDYTLRDPVRFSKRFSLLKRPYTIDSWDFQVEDAYTPRTSTTPVMTIDPERTKFGVFFGDNTGYMQACERLSEMLARAGRAADAQRFSARRDEIAERLAHVSWNGRFFRHFVEEDPTVKRDLGVDEAAQLAQGNAYSLNRGITHAQAVAILRSYQALSQHLPKGSPGEWYAIYPPFARGFGSEQETWQYMNGGVSGHAAGELARGAFAHGFERYGASVLSRAAALAERTDGIIHFAYTGAFPGPRPPPRFTPVSLARVANMDVAAPSTARPWMDGEPGNDLARLPHGKLVAGGAPFEVVDPAKNQRRVVLAVAARPDYPARVEVPIGGRKAGALYLLHTIHGGRYTEGWPVSPDEIAAGITFRYADGSERSSYLRRGKQVAGWWYPELTGPDAGVAWRGPNAKTGDVGLTWAALANPRPDAPIQAVVVSGSLEGSVYALAGLTLADHMPAKTPSPISYGGPDNWAGSTMVLALVEGLAGVRDTDRAYERAEVSPRWTATEASRARVVARYGSSRGYVAYTFAHDRRATTLRLTLTGSGAAFRARVLLPERARVRDATLDERAVPVALTSIEEARYAELDVPPGVHALNVRYALEPAQKR